jgi:hypothetical protein
VHTDTLVDNRLEHHRSSSCGRRQMAGRAEAKVQIGVAEGNGHRDHLLWTQPRTIGRGPLAITTATSQDHDLSLKY